MEKSYLNKNGITTHVDYSSNTVNSKTIWFYNADFDKAIELRKNRKNNREIKLGTSCKKTLEAINEKIDGEWFNIMVSSDTNWRYTQRYYKLSGFRDKLIRKNQQWCR